MTGPYLRIVVEPDTDWRDRGACRGVDPDLWFPGQGESTKPAKRVCATCPVVDDCLDYAIVNAETIGIWGGKSERERRSLRRARNRDLQKAAQA